MITALVIGELIKDPAERQTAQGKPWASAILRVAAGSESVLVNVTTFSTEAIQKLSKLQKGDSLAATGSLEMNRWADRDGNERTGWRLTASAVMTVYEANRRRKAASDPDQNHREPQARPAPHP